MKNIDLVREILLFLDKYGGKYFNGIMEINDYDKSEIDYCLQQMLDESLLIGHLLYEYDDVYFHGVGLSRKGYQALHAVKNDSVWLLFKQKIGEDEQSISIVDTVNVLKQLSDYYFKNKFSL
jgi:Hypothetical protein (DUF2513)